MIIYKNIPHISRTKITKHPKTITIPPPIFENQFSGLCSERHFRNNLKLRTKLEKYFNKKIEKIEKCVSGKKTDSIIIFEDGSTVNIQNKKVQRLNGIGNSFDSRPKKKMNMPLDFITKLEKLFPNIVDSRNSRISQREKKIFKNNSYIYKEDLYRYLRTVLIGENGDFENEYFVIYHTITNKNYIISSEQLYKMVLEDFEVDIKRTCFYLTPYLYLKRKGGDPKKYRCDPDSVQLMFKFTQTFLDRCDTL